MGFFNLGDLFGGSGGDDLAAGVAAFGAEVDDVVGGFDDVEVVFDDQDAVTGFDEPFEAFQEAGDIGEVEAGGGFIEDVEDVFAAAEFAEFLGELDALGFAA